MYQYLNGLINGLFKGKESITLLDKPSISVKRVNNVDQFSYEVYFDLNLRVNKSLMKNNDYNGKYIIGNAIVKDLRGIVILTPSFNETSEMTYTVQYRIPKTTNNKVEYT